MIEAQKHGSTRGYVNQLFNELFLLSLNFGRRSNGQTLTDIFYMAYFFVHSFASWLYFSLSVLKMRAISGTRGSSGLGSQSKEHTESKTLLIVRAGDHWDLRMSRQIDPLELMLGW